jgi:hypothetical protein
MKKKENFQTKRNNKSSPSHLVGAWRNEGINKQEEWGCD